MVDLSGGHDGPLEHAFSNSVFIVPGIVVISLTGKYWSWYFIYISNSLPCVFSLKTVTICYLHCHIGFFTLGIHLLFKYYT